MAANTKLGCAAQGQSRVFPREDFQKNGSNFFLVETNRFPERSEITIMTLALF